MIRCPRFEYRSPTQVQEVCRILKDVGPKAMLLAGGTDLVPNLKRRQQTPEVVVSLRGVEELRDQQTDEKAISLGATLTLAELATHPRLRADFRALHQATIQVATPHLRNMATLGGNLCLDTRCNYYDQSYEWRKAIGFCMKKEGTVCWVAPGSSKCWAVSSTDSAPALAALGAEVTLISSEGERTIPVHLLYQDDGIDYLSKRPEELVSRVRIPIHQPGARSTYWKLRRRGSFDFPVLSVAAWARLDRKQTVLEARLVLGAVASRPVLAEAATLLVGHRLEEDRMTEVAELGSRVAKPLDNTDFALSWRKRAAREMILGALRELRGDDPRTLGPIARRAAELVPAG